MLKIRSFPCSLVRVFKSSSKQIEKTEEKRGKCIDKDDAPGSTWQKVFHLVRTKALVALQPQSALTH